MKKYLLLVAFCSLFPALHAQYYGYHEEVDFESNSGFVRIDPAGDNAWQIGPPQKTLFSGAYSVPNAIVTDTVSTYPVQCNSSFYLSINNIQWFEGSPSTLGFYHKFDTDPQHDGGYIDVSYDGGASWLNIIYDSTMFNCSWTPGFGYWGYNFYGEEDTLFNGVNGFSGTTGDWQYAEFVWWYCIGVDYQYPDSMMIRFNFISDSINTNQEGWMIDDIVLHSDLCGGVHQKNTERITATVEPNPVVEGSILRINRAGSGFCLLKIHDIKGSLVFTGKLITNEFRLNPLTLDPGLYLYTLIFDDGPLVKGKFIVN